ncbi:MAG: DinB family protein [Dehalococcoidia bacterium]
MSDRVEIGLYRDQLVRWVDTIVGCMDGLSDDEVNWRPIPTGNSLAIVSSHLLGNLAQNVEALGGPAYQRDRDAEFRAVVGVADLQARWQHLRSQIEQTLAALPEGSLDRSFDHPQQGSKTGRDLIVVAMTHAAEHAGEAELTRDLIKDRRG